MAGSTRFPIAPKNGNFGLSGIDSASFDLVIELRNNEGGRDGVSLSTVVVTGFFFSIASRKDGRAGRVVSILVIGGDGEDPATNGGGGGAVGMKELV